MPSNDGLPEFLRLTEVLEPDQLPLQVLLLTMEVASMREALNNVGRLLQMPAFAMPNDWSGIPGDG